MSLILDALNRADTERKNQAPLPDVNTRHSPMALEPDEARSNWLWWGMALVVLAIILAALAWRWYGVEKSVPVALPAEQTRSLAAPAPAVVNTQPASQSSPLVARPAKQMTSAHSLGSVAAASAANAGMAATDVQNLYAEEAAAPVVAEADINQLYAADESPGSESIVDPFASPALPESASMVTETEREPARTFANSPVQDFNDLPWNTKQKMPTISYQRHDYLPGGISSVVINGQTLGMGNIVATGQFVVQDILVDGVVLKHGDRVFKLRALNGWINM